MPSELSIQQMNEALLDQLDDPTMYKRAVDAVNSFTRMRIREDSFREKILPTLTLTRDQLDRQVDTDLPVKVIDKEPDSPAAITVPLGTLSRGFNIYGKRYRVTACRIVTRKATADVDTLMTYSYDIRQTVSDNQIRDMLAEDDSKFIDAVDTILGAMDSTSNLTDTVQWKSFSGGMDRDNCVEAKKILPRTGAHFEAEVALTNNVSIKELEKWGRDEMGGDGSETIARDGWKLVRFLNLDWIVTIKRDLVQDNEVYYFTGPQFMGKAFEIEGTTMYVKREAFMLEYFAYRTLGVSIGNPASVAKATFE